MLEAALISQDRHKLRHLADEGNAAAIIMLELLANMDKLLAAILLCNNLANVICATTAAIIVSRLSGGWESAVFVSTLLVTFLILIFSEISPKVIGVRHAQAISLICAKTVRYLLFILQPITVVVLFFARGFLVMIGEKTGNNEKARINIRELRSIVRASSLSAEGAKDSEAHYLMMNKLLEFNDTPLEKIMTPRRDIIGINLADSEEIIAAEIISSSFSKMPVFEDNIDNTLGFIDIRQTMTKILERQNKKISTEELRTIVTPPLFIPASDTILRQMQKMRNSGQRIALVVEGTGRIVGLATIANFAFAVIGTPDLPSGVEDDSKEDGNGIFLLPADISLMQLRELFPHAELPTTSATNLNGLIQEYLGYIPNTAMGINIGNINVEIIEFSNKAVIKARVSAFDKKHDTNVSMV